MLRLRKAVVKVHLVNLHEALSKGVGQLARGQGASLFDVIVQGDFFHRFAEQSRDCCVELLPATGWSCHCDGPRLAVKRHLLSSIEIVKVLGLNWGRPHLCTLPSPFVNQTALSSLHVVVVCRDLLITEPEAVHVGLLVGSYGLGGVESSIVQANVGVAPTAIGKVAATLAWDLGQALVQQFFLPS